MLQRTEITSAYNFMPNPGFQMRVYCCPKPLTYVFGGNFIGKTYCCVNIAEQIVLENPYDSGYSYYPMLLGGDRKDEYGNYVNTLDKLPDYMPMPPGITKYSKVSKSDWIRPQYADYYNQLMRDEWGMKYELPTLVWLSEYTRLLHKDLTMNHKGKPFLPLLLQGHIAHPEMSDVHGVWESVRLKNGSELSLKTSKAQIGAYAGPSPAAIVLDEPHPSSIVGESQARVLKTINGKLFYIFTPVVQQDDRGQMLDVEGWRHIMWVKQNILPLLEDEEAMKINEIVHGVELQENVALSQAERDRFTFGILHGGQSQELKRIRLKGLLEISDHLKSLDSSMLDELKDRAISNPLQLIEGYLDLAGRFM